MEEDQETPDDQDAYFDPTTSNDQAAPDYDIGSTPGMHNQDDSQASSMTYQNIDTQIVPYMTPQTPQYYVNPHFSSVADVYANFRAEQFEHAPQFNSSPVPLPIELPDVVGEDGIGDISLEDASDDIECNDLDDANDYVNGNYLDDAKDDGDTSHASVTIPPAGPLQRSMRNIKHRRCGTGSHYIYKHRRRNGPLIAPIIISGHQFSMGSLYQAAAEEYLHAYKLLPNSPFVNLCVGTSLINLAFLIQGISFLFKYLNLCGETYRHI